MTEEPPITGLRLVHEHGRSLRVSHDGRELTRYVYRPWDPRLESPRPYFHPVHTLGGDLVSLYRPHDHVWHKGIAWSLPNVGPANFWGGVTYTRAAGYRQLPNNGTMRHRRFTRLSSSEIAVSVAESLDWYTEQDAAWFTEERSFSIGLAPADSAWTLAFRTALTNITDAEIRIGSPTTEGRPDAGYGGLFWRGPRSFSGGRVHAPGVTGGDDLMGIRAPWLAFTGRHDDHGRTSTLVFVDSPDNPNHPCQWFVRTGIYACLCPAPFFSEEVPILPAETLTLTYALTIADGDHPPGSLELLAKHALAAISNLGVA